MSKALKEFEKLIEHISDCKMITQYTGNGERKYVGYHKDYTTYEIDIDIIKDALKEQEQLKGTLITATRSPVEINNEHKALEIIKECVGVNMILFNAQEYGMSKEKIDLLKKVLL